MDQIQLSQIRAYGYTGVLPEEQILGQWFEVNLILWLDLAPAGHSDRLEDTLDYRAVISTVQQLVQTARFALLERLAAAIAEAILRPTTAFTVPVQQVQVRLVKPAAPIPNFGGSITIEIVRSRQEMTA